MNSWRDYVSASKQWGGSTEGRLVVIALCRYGDIFEQSRFLSLLGNRDWVLYCDPTLVELYSRLFSSDKVVSAEQAMPAHDFWVPIEWIHEGLSVSPLKTPPLLFSASPEKIKKYEFLRTRTPVIGVTWAAGEAEDSYKCRKISDEDLTRILENRTHIAWVNLQYKRTHPKLVNAEFETWEDTVGLIHNLDAVLSCDTSVPHLSATMGKKTIVLHARAQTSLTQPQPYELLYPGAVKMFTPDYGGSFSKTATDKFLDYTKQNSVFWNF